MRKIHLLLATLLLWTLSTSAVAKTTITRDGESWVVANAHVEARFAASGAFDLQQLTLNGHSLVTAGQNPSPWIMVYRGKQGENPELMPEHATYEGATAEDNTLTFTWLLTLDYSGRTYPVRMMVTLPDEGERLLWDLEADLPATGMVSDVHFPRIVVKRPADARVLTTEGWGVEHPVRTMTYEARYPSHASAMQFIIVHNPAGALFYGTEDRQGCGKTYSVKAFEQTLTFSTAIPASAGWIQEGTFRIPWSSNVGFTEQGWEDAVVRWYRPFTYTTEWGSKRLADRHIPQWLYNADAWIRVKGVEAATVEQAKRAVQYLGEGVGIHWYFWHNHPYDTHYPDYFPTKPGFADDVAAVQALGAHVTPYINGRLWDPAADSYRRDRGYDASCRKPDGSLYTEIYPTSRVLNTVTCPSTDIWHRKIIGLIDRLQKEVGVDGVYIDQIAAAAPEPCWNPKHNHPLGGGSFWYDGYRRLINKVRAKYLLPDHILTSEENAECYIDLFDMLLVVNTPHVPGTCDIRPVFPLVYSDRAVASAFTYTPTEATHIQNGELRYELTKALLWGSQIGWVQPQVIMDERATEEVAFMKTLKEFRRTVHDVVYGGQFLGEVALGGDNPTHFVPTFGNDYAVQAALWRNVEGKEVYLIVNTDNTPHRVTLPDSNRTVEVAGNAALRVEK